MYVILCHFCRVKYRKYRRRQARQFGSPRGGRVAYRQRLRPIAAVAALFAVCGLVESGQAQSNTCTLRPDRYNPSEQVLHCGKELTVQPAPGTDYHPVDAGPGRPPVSVQLDSGALFTTFHPGAKPRDFQILTPQAIASVRGTTWAVEASPSRTSVFVQTGEVTVKRARDAATVVLRQGEAVDVGSDDGPLKVERWPPARVRALLARFGRVATATPPGTSAVSLNIQHPWVAGRRAGPAAYQSVQSAGWEVEGSGRYVGSWSGFYIGANGGYGWGDTSYTVISEPTVKLKGGLLGGQIGYNLQFGSWVVGAEGDIDGADLTGWVFDSNAGGPISLKTKELASLRARLGYLVTSDLLAYGTGGAGWTSTDINANGGTGNISKWGGVAGGGIEYKFYGHWIARAEYLHYFVNGSTTLVDIFNQPWAVNVNSIDVVRAGLSYKF
jgi:opacity protein-like surface antigen